MSKIIDLTGQKFGRLTVLEKADRPNNVKNQTQYWKCICECDNEIIVSGVYLRNGETKSCGCLHKELNDYTKNIIDKICEEMIGNNYGNLTVIKKVPRPSTANNRRQYFLCKCVCGKEKIICSRDLKSGNTISCGCAKIHINPEEPKITSANNVFLRTYADGNLTFEQFLEISQQSCYYCNLIPSLSNCTNSFNGSNSEFSKKHGYFYYNGLDRVDSNLSHNLDNIVPCCKTCNAFKGPLSIYEFNRNIVKLKQSPIITTVNNINTLDIISLNKLSYVFPAKLNDKRKRNALLNKLDKIKGSANDRNILFELTKIQCVELIISSCTYCEEKANPSEGYYLGIDRLDNTKGYQPDNCVSCCKYCNYGKNTLTLEQFIDWIKRIKSHQASTHSIQLLLNSRLAQD